MTSFGEITAEELSYSLAYLQGLSGEDIGVAYCPRIERIQSKDPNPGGSGIHANCTVASLWTHED
jgi:hypothetical protein